jgi:hypothetical protein
MVAQMEREAEVRRVLGRYLVEIVEAYNLCPWARSTRQSQGELVIRIVWGAASADEVCAAAREVIADKAMRVAMLVVPELGATPRQLRELRDAVLGLHLGVGVADFHPDAPLDLQTPARLVPFLRRSPDPMLQIVPMAILDSVRTPTVVADLPMQVAMLDGTAKSTIDIGDRIAETNHASVSKDVDAIVARLADIAADRERSYARVGISASR